MRNIIPASAIDHFKCSECWRLLSIGPIRIKEDGKSICGRCSIPDVVLPARNYAYEAAANSYLFPCIYKASGCPAYISFNDPIQHEALCCYHIHDCPLKSGCAWSGIVKQLPEHYLTNHREMCVEGTTVQLNLQTNVIQPYLIYYKSSYFLLQIKCSDDEGKLWFNLIYLEDPEDVKFISYSLQLGSDKSKSHIMLEERTAMGHTYMQMDLNVSLDVDLKGIYAILKYPDNVMCNLSININEDFERQKVLMNMLRCPRCDYFMSPPIYECQHEHTCCADCKGFEMDCTWCKEDNNIIASLSRATDLENLTKNLELPCRWKGCNYKSKEIRQHEQECEMRKYKCPYKSCAEWSGSLNNLIEHLKTAHPQSKVHTTSNGTHTTYRSGSYEYIIAHGELFWCHFKQSKAEGGLLQIYYKGRPSLACHFRYELEVVYSSGKSMSYELSRFIKNRYEVRVPFLDDTDAKYQIKVIKCFKSYVNMSIN